MTRWGIETARDRGLEPVAVLLVGGREKLPADGSLDLGDVAVESTEAPLTALPEAIDRLRPDAVLDLSDEPVLGYRERMELASIALARGCPYLGADFRLDPPPLDPPPPMPTLAVIGTGKRTGKTAIGGHLARLAKAAGRRPVVVAMGRGGPPEPEVAEGSLDLERLRELSREGRHASSDYLEDALTAGVTTVGARRCAGGLAGAPFASNVPEAVREAERLGAGPAGARGQRRRHPAGGVGRRGSGRPRVAGPRVSGGYLGPYRLLRSDLLVITMVSGPGSGPASLSALVSHVHRVRSDARIAISDFVPTPLGDVEGSRVFFSTTASQHGADAQIRSLVSRHGVTVVGCSRTTRRSGGTGRGHPQRAGVRRPAHRAEGRLRRRGRGTRGGAGRGGGVRGQPARDGAGARRRRGRRSADARRVRLADERAKERSVTVKTKKRPTHIVIADREHGLPYSKGLMASQLMVTGLSPYRSYQVAERVEERLLERGKARGHQRRAPGPHRPGPRGGGGGPLRQELRALAGGRRARRAARDPDRRRDRGREVDHRHPARRPARHRPRRGHRCDPRGDALDVQLGADAHAVHVVVRRRTRRCGSRRRSPPTPSSSGSASRPRRSPSASTR